MVVAQFPPVDLADSNGLLAVGGDLEIETLLLAYKNGIFPWPFDEKTLTWFSPPKRCILYFRNISFTSRFMRRTKSKIYSYKKNTQFEKIVSNCALQGSRSEKNGTWITNQIAEAYVNLHQAGFADSYETYENGELIGGVYGVRINNFFAGESMYHSKRDGSKLSLWYAVNCLERENIQWMDCQVMNPFLQQIGAQDITREEYLKLLRVATN